MRFLLILLCSITCSFSALASYNVSLSEKLEARQSSFSEKADPQKVKDYNEGIKIVAQSGVLEKAKNVGDKAPDFSLPSAVETIVTLSELLQKGPVVLIWYRGEWCPYCNIYLQDIQDHAEQFKQSGASIVAISPEVVDRAMDIHDRLALGYHVLSDEKSLIAQEYGIVYELPEKIAGYLQDAFDIKSANNDERNLLPLSASYIIQQDGTIVYAYLNADYRQRAETSTLLEEVKKLK